MERKQYTIIAQGHLGPVVSFGIAEVKRALNSAGWMCAGPSARPPRTSAAGQCWP